MQKATYQVLGVMSGTSLDGIDLAHVTLEFDEHWQYQLHTRETVPYPNSWQARLKDLVTHSKAELLETDIAYTLYLSEVIKTFIEKHQLNQLDLVSSHGHTALHQPEKGLTYQIGNRSELATLTGVKTVCDFRVQDVHLGGQGAPLVPIGDRLLFSDYDFCLNLGGFANISMEQHGNRLAYDICPVNIVLNRYANKLGKSYDENGQFASHGNVDVRLLKQLSSLPFYQALPPKSLGLEWVENTIEPLLKASGLKPEAILATFTHHVAEQIAQVIGSNSHQKVLVTGGGGYNSYLMKLLSSKSDTKFVLPDSKLLEFKEALVFALLGVLKVRGEINCLSSVTGANKNHSSGNVFFP